MKLKSKFKMKQKITINTMFIIPLEELATYVLNSDEDNSLLLKYLHNNPLIVEIIIEKNVKNILRIHKLRVKLMELKFAYNDSDNFTHGVSYFNVKLRGTERELRKLEKSNNFTLFDWERKE